MLKSCLLKKAEMAMVGFMPAAKEPTEGDWIGYIKYRSASSEHPGKIFYILTGAAQTGERDVTFFTTPYGSVDSEDEIRRMAIEHAEAYGIAEILVFDQTK